ncbi:MAG: RsmE family RNA methyltransferase [Candidatus Fonsibacter sp.]
MSSKIRIYINKNLETNNTLDFDVNDSHYLNHVMRVKKNDQITVFNSKDGEFIAEIYHLNKKKITCKILKKNVLKVFKSNISLIFSLIKNTKLDFLIQKCTEIGVKQFIPVITDRSISKSINKARLFKIIKETAEQSGQVFLPEIKEVKKISDFLNTLNPKSKVFFGDINSKNIINNKLNINSENDIYFLVGPEGDFSLDEIKFLENVKNCTGVSLGNTILRSETAAIVGLTLFNSLFHQQ